VSSIDSTSALAAYLRSQLGPLSPLSKASRLQLAEGGTSAGTTPTGVTSSSQPKRRPAAKGQREDLAASVARRVASIDRTDPDRRRKAFRVLLESLLLNEWGDQLMNDPGFQQLVDEVQTQMESDARLVELMSEAADRMLMPAAR
jgi:hypothetical protein